MNTIVTKFGGSSLADSIHFKKVKNILESNPERKYIIPSAPGKSSFKDFKITDLLYLCHAHVKSGISLDDVFKLISERYKSIVDDLNLNLDLTSYLNIIKTDIENGASVDYTASRGEYLNGIILANYLNIDFIDAKDVIKFNKYGTLNIEETYVALKDKLSNHERAVIPGFYGSNEHGDIVTFSRGGSDITGSLVARAVNADLYENWTDVSGFLIADPRIVKGSKSIETITYKELRELSYMGASVLHEDAIFPVRRAGIPINIRNTNAPADKGTLIVEATCCQPKYTITGIAGTDGFAAITIEKAMMNSEVGFCRKVLQVFEDNGVSIEHMPSGIDTMTIFVHKDKFEEKEQQILAGIHKAVDPDHIELESDLALIAIVGRGMKSTRGTAGRIFSALAHAHINVKMIDQGSSELNIIVGVRHDDFKNAIKALYEIFVLTQI